MVLTALKQNSKSLRIHQVLRGRNVEASQVSEESQTYPESKLFCEIEACIGPVERLEEVPTDRVYHEISVV